MVQKNIIPHQTTIAAKKWNGVRPQQQPQQQQGVVVNHLEKMNRYSNILPYDNTRVVLKKPREGKSKKKFVSYKFVAGFQNYDYIYQFGICSNKNFNISGLPGPNKRQILLIGDLKKSQGQKNKKRLNFQKKVSQEFHNP
jgi:protein tyrosine phosphatase